MIVAEKRSNITHKQFIEKKDHPCLFLHQVIAIGFCFSFVHHPQKPNSCIENSPYEFQLCACHGCAISCVS
ncbi:hypothetical protein L6452_28812 [Arctium lappa]|uniref:Uncharacterized protein n=1 Tax=Arctium lappa TaxID=4217 RepID=A0ACB8ZYK5_ARCLA|nr:hypothetical protein L6452_28812 [Arctium lappa]